MDDFDLKEAFIFRQYAGRVTNENELHKRKKALAARCHAHWEGGPKFSEKTLNKESWRLCPYYSGMWNPVMWSDYPKQPAWTVPLPKMPVLSICNRFQDGPRYHCNPVTPEVIAKAQFACLRQGVPVESSNRCNPYISDQSIPLKGFREFPRKPEVNWKHDHFTCDISC